jgi:transcriptional regulator with XRE-family HTH domain
MSKEPKKQQPEKGEVTVLRKLREQAGLTREQLVTRMENRITVGTLARWENTPMEPAMTRQDWLNFCAAIGIPWEKLPQSLSAPWMTVDFPVREH